MKTLKTLLVIAVLFTAIGANAQLVNPVKWKFESKRISNSVVEVKFTAHIDAHWHLYNLNIPEGGPIATSIKFLKTKDFKAIGKPKVITKPIKVFDKMFDMNVEYFENKAVFTQKILAKKGKEVTIKGLIEYMSCNDGQCTPPTEAKFAIKVK